MSFGEGWTLGAGPGVRPGPGAPPSPVASGAADVDGEGVRQSLRFCGWAQPAPVASDASATNALVARTMAAAAAAFDA
jgi:hypothetical protein